MSPQQRRHTPASRDMAMRRRRQVTVAAAMGGLSVVGGMTGLLAWGHVASASTGAGSSSGAASGSMAASPSTAAPSDSSPSGSLSAPTAAPTPSASAPQAVTGGSGHG
jgi:hypothetical protein